MLPGHAGVAQWLEFATRFLEAIRAGASRNLAAGYAGWSYAGLGRYLEKGARHRKGKFRAFRRQYEAALSEAQMGFVLKISAAATRDWRAAAWLLGRLNPADFARQESMTLKTQDGGGLPIQIIHSIPSAERPARGTAQVIALDGGEVTGPKAAGPDEV